jgi:hypothetical protein
VADVASVGAVVLVVVPCKAARLSTRPGGREGADRDAGADDESAEGHGSSVVAASGLFVTCQSGGTSAETVLSLG